MAGLCFVVKMKQVWHLFRHDVKRSWPLLAGWLAFLLFAFARELRDPLERIDATVSPMGWLHWESTVAWLAVAAGTGMLFVSDTPVGNRVFWKTRPIERWAMLASTSARCFSERPQKATPCPCGTSMATFPMPF